MDYWLLGQAKPKMINSTVVDNETGKSIASTVRTSTGTFFGPHEDSVIEAIEERIAVATHFPEENGEGIQVSHCSGIFSSLGGNCKFDSSHSLHCPDLQLQACQ